MDHYLHWYPHLYIMCVVMVLKCYRIFFYKKENIPSNYSKTENIGAQMNFHHGKQHGFFRSVGKCYTYQNEYLPHMAPLVM